MPNAPEILTVSDMIAYRELIIKTAMELDCPWFDPLMTMYLKKNTDPLDILKASELQWFAGFKLYPQGVTTGSEGGVSDVEELEPLFKLMEKYGVKLLIHPEEPGEDPIIAEEAFIAKTLPKIMRMFGGKISLEHCSTKSAIDVVKNNLRVHGTLTVHHLNGNYDEMLASPFNYCKPVWPSEENRLALIDALANLEPFGNRLSFGSDSAPHLARLKQANHPENPKYGCFSAPITMSYYLRALCLAFGLDDLDELLGNDTYRRYAEDLFFKNAAKFYGLPDVGWAISNKEIETPYIKIIDEWASPPPQDGALVPPFPNETLKFTCTPVKIES